MGGLVNMGKAGKRILFSRKDDWEAGIKAAIGTHTAHFHEFSEVDADRFDLVVPLKLEDARHFNRRFAHLNRVKALVPSNHAIDACDDKQAFARRISRAGFGCFLPRAGDGLPHPYLLKKRIGEWGMGIHLINDADDESMHEDRLGSNDYLKQEYVHGQQEYTTHMLMSRGRNAFMRTLEFTFAESFFVKGKSFSPVSQACVDHSRFSRLFEDILNCVGFQGFCCFNYKLMEGQPRIFEVNPRYGASLTCFLGEAISSLWQALPARN
ncbi:MAG TPA: ATP-grasp domain-containing protein, partial [Pseudoxanthomonas sp.]|nr:ATP-grasp domain-containing protein [Pseudoxanthomonas sp.]